MFIKQHRGNDEKKIIKSSFVLVLSVFILFNQAIANDLLILKHEFGRRGWVDGRYENAEIYPLSNPTTIYSISSQENEEKKSKYKVHLDLSIKQKDSDALATIKFKNRSNESYFIMENRLPYKYITLPSNGEIPISPLFCGLSFNVTTNDIKLFFFESTCGYPGDLDLDEWVEIPAGKGLSFTIKMNDYLYFMPGEINYNIESSEFFIVTKKWFIEKSINDKLFSIFSTRIYKHQTKKDYNNALEINKRYVIDCDSCELKHFMQRFDLNGSNIDYSFEIRTNEVSVAINGDRLHSLYDK